MTPEQDFVFKETIERMINLGRIVIDGEPPIETVRGISLKQSNKIFINLSAVQWQLHTEDTLKESLTETIIHEHTHILLKDYTSIGNSDMEEHICKVMAGQEEIRSKV